jgi:hypothetical protein
MQIIAHPSIVLPKFLVADRTISRPAKLLLALLDDYRNKVTGQCNPRIARLALDLAVSRRTVERALRELQRWKLIVVTYCQRMSKYVLAARDQWQKLLQKACAKPPQTDTFSKAAASPDARNQAAENIGQNPIPDTTKCRNVIRQNVVTETSLSLLTEPTDRTYLSNSGGAHADRSVDHVEVAAATPAIVNDLCEDEPTPRPPRQRPLRSKLSEPLWRELCAVHPQPGKALAALEEIDCLLHNNWQQAEQLARALRKRHLEWREYWNTLEAGSYIPQLWRWVKEGEWIMAPVIRKPALRAFATKGERIKDILDRIERKAAGLS